jgi:hypothetical protein
MRTSLSARTPLLAALLRRELLGGGAAQRMLVVASGSALCGPLAAGAAGAPGVPRGLLGNVVADFVPLAVFTIGVMSGLRLVAALYEDQGAGWLTPLFAAGTPRAAYLGQLGGAVLASGAFDLLLALGSFAAAQHLAGGAAPLQEIRDVLAAGLPWLAAVLALAALCAVSLGERTRARFALVLLLLLPYLATFLFAFLNDDRALPRLMAVVLLYGVPLWSPAPTPRSLALLLLYGAITLGLALALARSRIDRCP